jgi:hypothetical protein
LPNWSVISALVAEGVAAGVSAAWLRFFPVGVSDPSSRSAGTVCKLVEQPYNVSSIAGNTRTEINIAYFFSFVIFLLDETISDGRFYPPIDAIPYMMNCIKNKNQQKIAQ